MTLTPEDERLAPLLIIAASAEYKESDQYCTATLEITYGIPSPQKTQDYNAQIGKPIKGLFDDKPIGINDSIPLRRPDNKTFEMGKRVVLLAGLEQVLFLSDEKTERIAKTLKISPKQVNLYYEFIREYYDGLSLDREKINL